MKTGALVEGIALLENYRDDKDGYNLGAEHDIIYCYATDRPLSEPDIQKMLDLGWFQEVEYADEDEMKVCDYEQDESWCAYT